MSDQLLEVFRRCSMIRAFEEEAARRYDAGEIKCPLYLSLGQEFVAAAVSIAHPDATVFVQHRCHSWFLAYGGDLKGLADELRGKETGCCCGWGGSSNIYLRLPDWEATIDVEAPIMRTKVYGHDGLVGTQAMYGVGFAFASKKTTVIVLGDAACEEDYVLGAMAFAGTHRVPALFIVEDNDLSILTKKKVRRDWTICDIATGFGIGATFVGWNVGLFVREVRCANPPLLFEVPVVRERWHAGTGIDADTPESYWPRFKHSMMTEEYGVAEIGDIIGEAEQKAREAWA